tara:strand:+ start:458 stop:661 length:204 start_codon:yes stop_codon:yes gene_type:complete
MAKFKVTFRRVGETKSYGTLHDNIQSAFGAFLRFKKRHEFMNFYIGKEKTEDGKTKISWSKQEQYED